MSEFSIRYFLTSDDPLSEEAFKFLIKYREEDDLLDFKEAFDPDSEKEWLEVTKDVMAFANTKGGYIVFGVRDATFELVGVDENTAKVLTNTNNFLQKINRFLDPHINLLRSKELVCDGKRVVAIWIPESIGKTHLVLKDAEFEFLSGRKKNILNRGTFYIRRSGGNQLADARVVEDIVEKRLNLLKETLLSKIARVVEAPPESEIFVLSQDPTAEPHKRFIIDDAPEAIPVKGMSFTISPVTGEQEVAAWTAMWAGDSAAIPPSRTLWRWYAERDNFKLSEKLRLQLGEFCLLSDVPTFYWLRGCSSESIGEFC
jgi:hypothetical protein